MKIIFESTEIYIKFSYKCVKGDNFIIVTEVEKCVN